MIPSQAASILTTAGLRPTSQRVLVLDALSGRQTAVSAQELHHELRRRGKSAGLATIYRALSALADAGAVDRFMHDGEQRFRMCGDTHHHHLVCRRCGSVQEVTSKAVESWVKSIARSRRFRVTDHSADVYGVCASCA